LREIEVFIFPLFFPFFLAKEKKNNFQGKFSHKKFFYFNFEKFQKKKEIMKNFGRKTLFDNIKEFFSGRSKNPNRIQFKMGKKFCD